MAEKVRLAVIGLGKHARANVLPSLYRLEDAEIVSVCDVDEATAEEIGARYRVPARFGDYNEMVKAVNPDAVIVCTGPVGHAAIAIDLMNAGIDVYTEKPTAPSLESALEMLRVKESTGRICMTGFKKRYAPAYMKAKAMVASPEFGERGVLEIMRSAGSPGKRRAPERDSLLGWTCHVLDLAPYLWGQAVTVKTETHDAAGNFAWSVDMRHVDAAPSHTLLTTFPACEEETLFLCGSGEIVISVENSVNMTATRNRKPIDVHAPAFSKGHSFSDIEQGFAGELVAFIDAVRSRDEPEGNIRQACHTMAIFEAMMRSASTGDVEEVGFGL